MLTIFNTLKHFFLDNYRKINVREYARITNISPPSASKLLNNLEKEGLLKKEKDKLYIYYSANRENKLFINLLRAYWNEEFKKIGLIEYLNKELLNPVIILFGSFSKAEIMNNSDVDIAIFSIFKNNINLNNFEKKLKRKIQVFMFKNQEEVKNKDLLKNILNGYNLSGSW